MIDRAYQESLGTTYLPNGLIVGVALGLQCLGVGSPRRQQLVPQGQDLQW